ncbi:TIGR04282 family arsenosugar biosynthesis glycosyltransferase [Runella sp.]
MNCILIVFVKNPVPGKVKTRVAATVGDEKAVMVYLELLKHTKDVITKWLAEPNDKAQKRAVIYYGDYINSNDLWDDAYFLKKLQVSLPDLGMRMQSAFEEELTADAARVVIIGSDCLALRPEHLSKAFEELNENDAVIGPADDGGYYLLGMKKLLNFLFENKSWSQPILMEETLADLNRRKTSQDVPYTYQLLETLSDIDTWEDYLRELKAMNSF